jgi:CRISPR-associated endonuclease/helicase Cas3
MKPLTWPDDLDYMLAKSADRGGETLAQHTWDVLEKLAALRRLRPTLAVLSGVPELWHCLFWTCFFHDFGKVARGFQARLKGGEPWPQRHEVLSLAFFDWIAPALSEHEQYAIVAAIASHHRDASEIQQKYPRIDSTPLELLLNELDSQVISQLWHWVDSCAANWIETLSFSPAEVRLLPLMLHDQAVALVEKQGVEQMRFWLRRYERWVDDLRNTPLDRYQVVFPILLRGLTTTADHMASAHLKKLADPIQEDWQDLQKRILKPGQRSYYHQELSAARAGKSALLNAPTGSGKTESALYWTLGDGSSPVPRLFYALPYQASMNAMFDRLRDEEKGFGKAAVGLQHGRALQALYARLIDQEAAPSTPSNILKWEKNIDSLHARPVKVFSPYQMLKAAFQLRGFEGMLTDYAQAAFIFDEIHAYEPERLALILAMVEYLRKNFGARFFVMSATFPKIIRDKLIRVLELSPTDIITADENVFKKFRRHRLHLLKGGLLEDGIGRIVSDARSGKSVLVCVNTVRRAQAVREELLRAGLAPEQVLLIHSRYILKDRIAREQEILERCAIGVKSQPLVLVATQVVEVSLNIDLDTIYTDPAPLEALLQRFGRVNRACAKHICPVYVFQLPDDGQYVYDERLVQTTLAELAQHNGDEIDESQLHAWLDRIYDDQKIEQQWNKDYERVWQSAHVILDNLRPFDGNELLEQEFEAMFDNVEVLPKRFEREYLQCLADNDFLQASQYFVGISKNKYQQLANKGLISSIADPGGKQRKSMVRLPYNDLGLSFDDSEPDFD